MVVFHTDLDNTIMYSWKYDTGADRRCVEVYHDKEITYITHKTYLLLQELKKHVLIVPTTTRTPEQYHRLDLGVGSFPYVLACNGGILLVDGREDSAWYQGSQERIRDSREGLDRAVSILEKDARRCFDVRLIRELFVFTKCRDSEAVAQDLRAALDAQYVDVFWNGEKVYVVPSALNKGTAVERFRSYVDCEQVIAAGDSAFDIPMLEAADLGIAAPLLAKVHRFSDKVRFPPADRLYAEALLEMVSDICGRH